MHPAHVLHNFAGFLVDLFPWDPTGGSYVFEVAGFADTLESPAFSRALVNMSCLSGVEFDDGYQKLLFEFAHNYIDYTHSQELHVYLFDELLATLKQALKEKKERLLKERARRHELIFGELMERAWHPSRFQKWCCDIDEQSEFREMGWNPDEPVPDYNALALAASAAAAGAGTAPIRA
jgi:hypothetical protein